MIASHRCLKRRREKLSMHVVVILQTQRRARKVEQNLALSTCVTGMRFVCFFLPKVTRFRIFFQNLGKLEPGSLVPPGIHTLADVLEYGRDKGVCPYFTVRRMVHASYLMLFSLLPTSSPVAFRGCCHLLVPLSSRS